MKRLFLLILIVLSQPAWSQSMTPQQKEIIDKLGVYYRELGLKSKADWLKQEVAAGRIRFGPTEPGETAVTDMPTRVITINDKKPFLNYSDYVDLGYTMYHERVHQNQDPEIYNSECWRETFYLGNACEREGWATGFRAVRNMANILRDQAKNAPSSRERAQAAARLEATVSAWQTLTNDWFGKGKKLYGDMTVTDDQGFPISWEEMEKERKEFLKVAATAKALAGDMMVPFTGTYSGPISEGANGKLTFQINTRNEVLGTIGGNYRKGTLSGTFKGRIRGQVDIDGNLKADVVGELKMTNQAGVTFDYEYTGRMTGNLTKNAQGGSGRWTAGEGAMNPSGAWRVTRQ
ncbi:MAG: hypothetical protein KC800_32715 [Candidatus Eremiobacteraeota bacterium]|nr:hypothetical protein [Candidatus Eremiobacteraeota bacterium]